MSKLDLNALNELPKVDRILALAETNAELEKLDAEGRVAWALDNLPGEYVLSSSFWHSGGGEPASGESDSPGYSGDPHRHRLSVPGNLPLY